MNSSINHRMESFQLKPLINNVVDGPFYVVNLQQNQDLNIHVFSELVKHNKYRNTLCDFLKPQFCQLRSSALPATHSVDCNVDGTVTQWRNWRDTIR